MSLNFMFQLNIIKIAACFLYGNKKKAHIRRAHMDIIQNGADQVKINVKMTFFWRLACYLKTFENLSFVIKVLRIIFKILLRNMTND